MRTPFAAARSATVAAGSIVVAAGSIVVACVDSSAPLSTESVDGGGTVVPPGDGGSEPDASEAVPDAGPDVEADAAPRICSDDGFCHSVLPEGEHLRNVWGDGTGVVWAVSLERHVLRWDGASWKVHAEIKEAPSAIWGSGPTDLWIVTAAGLLHGQGPSSSELVFAPVLDLPGDATISIRSIWGTGPNDIWAVGGADTDQGWPYIQKGRVLHYGGDGADGGGGWTVDVELSSQNIGYRAVWGSPGTGTWVHGIDTSAPFDQYRARVLRRPPGASSWTSIDLPDDPGGGPRPYAADVRAANMSSDASVWLFGKSGFEPNNLVWHGTSVDGGSTFTWSAKRLNSWERPIFAFWGQAANDTWAVGELGLVSRYDGMKWKQAAIRVTGVPVGETLWAIWGTSSDDFWVVGDEIALHRTKAGKP